MRKALLVVAAIASVVIATAAGVYYWDALVLVGIGALLWIKKLATLKGLLLLLKKAPFLLLIGLKRLAIKVTSHFLMFTANLHFHRLQYLLRHLRIRAKSIKLRLKFQWEDLARSEQVLAVFAALPLIVLLSTLMLIFVIPKVIITFITQRIGEHSSAAVLKQVASLGAKDALDNSERKIKDKIREKLRPSLKPKSDSASGEP